MRAWRLVAPVLHLQRSGLAQSCEEKVSHGYPAAVPHPVRREHLVPHPVSDHNHRAGLGPAVLQAALQRHPRSQMDASLWLLGKGLRAVLRAWGRVRDHHELSVRHQLAGVHGNRGQCRGAASGLRGADGVFPRGRLSGHHAVRGHPRTGLAAHAGHLSCCLRHDAVGLLDHRAEQLDAHAAGVRAARRRGACGKLDGNRFQPVDALPPYAYAAGIRSDRGLPDRGAVGLPPPAGRPVCLGGGDPALRAGSGRRADPGADGRGRCARAEHAEVSAREDRGDGRQLGNRRAAPADPFCLAG